MKILFYDWALHTIGGGQKFNCKIAEYLSRLNHEVHILTLFLVNKEQLEEYYSVNLDKIKFISMFKSSNIHPTRLKLQVSNKISRLSARYDLFFNADAQETINPQARHNIMYAHFFEPKQYRPARGFGDWVKLKAISTLKSIKGNYASKYKIYCNSNYTQHWLKQLWNVPSKVLYPPVDIPHQIDFKKQNIIISVGRITPDKNYEFVINLFKQSNLQTYKLIICGKADNQGYLTYLKRLAHELNVEFKTDLTDSELKDIYQKARIFIQAKGMKIDEQQYPGLLEHFGMTTAEAMAYGCIPIVLNKGGYKEIIDPSTGFAFNTFKEALNILSRLEGNEQLLDSMSKAGTERAKMFSLEKMQKEIDELLENLS